MALKCFFLKVDANCCCNGCRDRIRRFLKDIEGMKKVKVSKDDAHLPGGSVMISVCGDGINEADIVSQLRKRRSISGVEVLKRLPHTELPGLENSIDRTSPHDKPEKKLPHTELPGLENSFDWTSPRDKPEKRLPHTELPGLVNSIDRTSPRDKSEKKKCDPPSCEPTNGVVPAPQVDVSAISVIDTNTAMKGEAAVTERVYKEFEGTKIRTRVTTSPDACTCVCLEEIRFIIDKQQVVKNLPRSALVFDDTTSPCQNPGNLKLSITPRLICSSGVAS